jgi:hypothetical protein
MSYQKSLRNLRIETGGASSPSQKGEMRMHSLTTSVEFNTTELERLFASLLEDSLPEAPTDVEVLWLLTINTARKPTTLVVGGIAANR